MLSFDSNKTVYHECKKNRNKNVRKVWAFGKSAVKSLKKLALSEFLK